MISKKNITIINSSVIATSASIINTGMSPGLFLVSSFNLLIAFICTLYSQTPKKSSKNVPSMINNSMEVNSLQPTPLSNTSATPPTAPSDNVQKEVEASKEQVERKETVQATTEYSRTNTTPDAMLGSQINTHA